MFLRSVQRSGVNFYILNFYNKYLFTDLCSQDSRAESSAIIKKTLSCRW